MKNLWATVSWTGKPFKRGKSKPQFALPCVFMITYFPFFAWHHFLVKIIQGENIMQPRTKPLIFISWGTYTNNLWKSSWAIFYISWSLILPTPYWSSQCSDFFNTLFSKNDFCLDIRHLVDHESHNDIHDDQASIEDENYNHYLKKVVQVITGNSKWRNHSRSPLKSIWANTLCIFPAYLVESTK